MRCTLIMLFATSLSLTNSAKILGVFPIPAYNHYSLAFVLMKELALRGHEVMVVSPFQSKEVVANFTDVLVDITKYPLQDIQKTLYEKDKMDSISSIIYVHQLGFALTQVLLSDENFQTILHSKKHFDLIIFEYFMNEALLGIGELFKAPTVLLSFLPSCSLNNHMFANPAPASYIPNVLTEYTGHMNFWQRAKNMGYNTFNKFYKQFYMLPRQEGLLKDHINSKIRLNNIMDNANLILLNSHPTVSQPVPHVPNMVEIGGFHIGTLNPLPKDIENFMIRADHGVVIFSMGSAVSSLDIHEKDIRAILKSFKKLDHYVLWEFGNDLLDLPSNVKIVRRLPQKEVLAHPNTKAFITLGDLMSMIEAVHFGVPIIGIPIYGDQKSNVALAVEKGFAVSIPFDGITEEKMTWALNEVLSQAKYLQAIELLSKIMKDRVVEPLNVAVHWVQHVIHFNGAKHLQSPGVSLTCYQRSMLDIIIALIIVDVLLFLIFYYIFKHIIHYTLRKIKARKAIKENRYAKLDEE